MHVEAHDFDGCGGDDGSGDAALGICYTKGLLGGALDISACGMRLDDRVLDLDLEWERLLDPDEIVTSIGCRVSSAFVMSRNWGSYRSSKAGGLSSFE
ncbi:hypothetical protein MRX96_053393, partial [Rhipicephalus microplus]